MALSFQELIQEFSMDIDIENTFMDTGWQVRGEERVVCTERVT